MRDAKVGPVAARSGVPAGSCTSVKARGVPWVEDGAVATTSAVGMVTPAIATIVPSVMARRPVIRKPKMLLSATTRRFDRRGDGTAPPGTERKEAHPTPRSG